MDGRCNDTASSLPSFHFPAKTLVSCSFVTLTPRCPSWRGPAPTTNRTCSRRPCTLFAGRATQGMSVGDLEATTSLGISSLYHAFGDQGRPFPPCSRPLRHVSRRAAAGDVRQPPGNTRGPGATVPNPVSSALQRRLRLPGRQRRRRVRRGRLDRNRRRSCRDRSSASPHRRRLTLRARGWRGSKDEGRPFGSDLPGPTGAEPGRPDQVEPPGRDSPRVRRNPPRKPRKEHNP